MSTKCTWPLEYPDAETAREALRKMRIRERAEQVDLMTTVPAPPRQYPTEYFDAP